MLAPFTGDHCCPTEVLGFNNNLLGLVIGNFGEVNVTWVYEGQLGIICVDYE